MTNKRKEPLLVSRFRVEIDGIIQSGMAEANGLEMFIEPTAYREGTDPLHVVYTGGLTGCGTLKVKFPLTESREIYEWFKLSANEGVQRRNISIVAMNNRGEDKACWHLIDAWPSKYKAPDFNAKSNDVAMETLEIVYERIERVS